MSQLFFSDLVGGAQFCFRTPEGQWLSFMKLAKYGDSFGTIHRCKPVNAVNYDGELVFIQEKQPVILCGD